MKKTKQKKQYIHQNSIIVVFRTTVTTETQVTAAT